MFYSKLWALNGPQAGGGGVWHKPNPQSWLGWRKGQRFVCVSSSKQTQHLKICHFSWGLFVAALTGRDIWCPSDQLILRAWYLWSGCSLISEMDLLWSGHLISEMAFIMIWTSSDFCAFLLLVPAMRQGNWPHSYPGNSQECMSIFFFLNLSRSLNTSQRIWARHFESINHCLDLYQ